MGLQPRHQEAILTPGSSIGSDARFQDAVAINSAKGLSPEAVLQSRAHQDPRQLNAAKATAKAADTLHGALMARLMECHQRAIAVMGHERVSDQDSLIRLASYFASVSSDAETIAAALVQKAKTQK